MCLLFASIRDNHRVSFSTYNSVSKALAVEHKSWPQNLLPFKIPQLMPRQLFLAVFSEDFLQLRMLLNLF